MRVNWASSMTQKGEEVSGENEWMKEEDSNECVSYWMLLQFADTLLDCIDERGFKYCDITATRIIHIAVRRNLNSWP
jgi:hypothetical protein